MDSGWTLMIGIAAGTAIVTHFLLRPKEGAKDSDDYVSAEGKEFFDKDGAASSSHTGRLVGLLIVFAIVFLAGRSFLIPKSFGQDGYYRADALTDSAEREPFYMEGKSCFTESCHDYEHDDLQVGLHYRISCVTCHGPEGHSKTYADVHDEDAISNLNTSCMVCHEKLTGRSVDVVPQIGSLSHRDEYKYDEETGCTACHSTHNLMLTDRGREAGGE